MRRSSCTAYLIRRAAVTWRWRRSAASPERDATWTPRIKITSRMPRPDLGDISATTVQHLRHGSRAYLSDISDLARELVRSELLLLLVCCDRLGGDLFGRDHLVDEMYARNKEMISFGGATWTEGDQQRRVHRRRRADQHDSAAAPMRPRSHASRGGATHVAVVTQPVVIGPEDVAWPRATERGCRLELGGGSLGGGGVRGRCKCIIF